MEWLGVLLRLFILMDIAIVIIIGLEVAVFIADIKREEKDNETDSESK